MNKQILRLALPNIISNISVPLLGMVDIAIMGHMDSESYIGAVAIGVTIFNFIYWNFGFLRMGTSGFTAQAYGAKDLKESVAVLTRSLSVAFIIALLLLLLQSPIGNLSFRLIEGDEKVEALALQYFLIRIWAAPATLGLYAFKGWFIGMQNSKTPMLIAIVSNVINIILGLFLVFYLKMNIAGVAWATVTAQYSGLLLAIIIWIKYYGKLARYIHIKDSLQLKSMLRFFIINGDIFLRTSCLVLVFTFFTSVSARYGNTILAVNALLMQLFTLFSYIMDGFAYVGESLTGKYIGSRNKTMLQKTIRYLFLWGIGLCVSFMLLYSFAGKELLGLFTNKIHIINVAQDYFHWILLVPLAGFAAFLWDGIFIGATATAAMRNAMFIATIVFFAIYYGLNHIIGNNALWLAFIFYLGLRGLMQTFYANKAILRKI